MFFYGFDQSCLTWYWHGEAGPSSGPKTTKAERCAKNQFFDDVDCTIEMVKAAHDDFHADEEIFNKLLQDAEKPLYQVVENLPSYLHSLNYTI